MKKSFLILTAFLLVTLIIFGLVVTAYGYYINVSSEYSVDEVMFEAAKESNTTTYLAYNNGSLITVAKESAGAAKSWVSIQSVSEKLKEAFVSAEDRKFYSHHGIDLKRTIAAAANCMFHYADSFGASTITQQVVKNISGDNERTFRRKAAELMRALRLEMTHTKEEILEVYLNIVPMSGNIYGVREATLRYFGKEPSELSVAEAATVAGIANAPTRYDPVKCHDECLRKRNTVLYAMLDNGAISKSEYEEAVESALEVSESVGADSEVYSWFVETAREDALTDISEKYGVSRVGARTILNSGSTVILTVDMRIQRILESFFENPANLSNEIQNGLEYAMVVSDSKTGDTLGIIGAAGKKSGNRLLNFASIPHPPASTLKPLALYGPLIDIGELNWSTVFDDVPSETGDVDGEIIMYPQNSPNIYDGRINAYDALRTSKNTTAVSMYKILGSDKIYDILLNKFGFSNLVRTENINGRICTDLGPSALALGQLTKGVTLSELTHAYTAFPSDGILRGGRTYYGIFDKNGDVILDNNAPERRVFKTETARVMNQMLTGVAESGTAKAITIKESVDTAAKTGTSSGNRDKLLVGYTPYFTAGIWCGYRDGVGGIYSHTPNHIEIWDSIMRKIHTEACNIDANEEPEAFRTEGLVREEYCKDSGCHACEGCFDSGSVAFGYFTKEDKNGKFKCPLHELCG